MSHAATISNAISQVAISRRLGIGLTAVNNAVGRGKFPSAWFPVIREMCREAGIECPESAFNFKTPSSATPLSEAS